MTQQQDNPIETLYNLGQVHRASGQLDLALESFQRALSIDPAFAPAALEPELLKKEAASLTAVELMVLASYRALIDVPGGGGESGSVGFS